MGRVPDEHPSAESISRVERLYFVRRNWHGEAPGRSDAASSGLSSLRGELERQLAALDVALDVGPMRRGRPKAELVLTDEERTVLERYARRGATAQRLSHWAPIVLACADGANGVAPRALQITVRCCLAAPAMAARAMPPSKVARRPLFFTASPRR